MMGSGAEGGGGWVGGRDRGGGRGLVCGDGRLVVDIAEEDDDEDGGDVDQKEELQHNHQVEEGEVAEDWGRSAIARRVGEVREGERGRARRRRRSVERGKER